MRLLVILPILLSAITIAVTSVAAFAADTPTPTRITEDDPRWDCHTMGNLICGTD